jgi:hypothetical protein
LFESEKAVVDSAAPDAQPSDPSPTWEASLIFDVAAASRFCCGYPLFNACCAVCKIDALGQ